MSAGVRALLAGLFLTLGVSTAAEAGQVRFSGEGHAFHPVFSVDGKYIAFEVNQLAGQIDLYVAELNGAIAKDAVKIVLPGTNAFAGGDVVAANAVWHPKEKGVVVFEGSNTSGQYRLYYYQATGGAPGEMITTTELPGHITFPTIAPSGGTMALVAKQTGNGDVRIRDNNTGKLSQATSTSETESFPLFSPDGTEMLFTRRHAETEDIFYLQPSTGMEKSIVGGPGDQSRPNYARAGSRVLYFDGARGENLWDLMSVDENGGDVKKLAKSVKLPLRARPSISPDGEWVAYVLDDPQQANKILLSKVDGTKTIEVPTEHTACGEPAMIKQGERVLLAYTALPSSGAEWRFLMVVDITDKL